MRSIKKINYRLSEGDLVRLAYAPCIHESEVNAYIGFEGIVKLDANTWKDGEFSLFSGRSWLINVNINTDKFQILKKNKSGLFSINGTKYYSVCSVIHKPKKCCKCGFIPVEYILAGFFKTKTYCSNCVKNK